MKHFQYGVRNNIRSHCAIELFGFLKKIADNWEGRKCS